MKQLEKEYEVHRFDIKTSEKKIVKKYTDTIKVHGKFDIRLEEDKFNQLLKLDEYSLQKIFSLIEEYPEEHILFLYLCDNKNQGQNQIKKSNLKKNNQYLERDSSDQLNSSDIRLDTFDIESPPSNSEIINENHRNDNNIPQYICIFSLLYFIIAGLLLIHLLQFFFSKEVKIYFIIFL